MFLAADQQFLGHKKVKLASLVCKPALPSAPWPAPPPRPFALAPGPLLCAMPCQLWVACTGHVSAIAPRLRAHGLGVPPQLLVPPMFVCMGVHGAMWQHILWA